MLSPEDHPDYWYGSSSFYDPNGDVQLGSLDSISERASTCNVCKMVCEALEGFISADELAERFLARSTGLRCRLWWQEHGRATRTDRSYSEQLVKPIFRMNVAIGSRTLKNIFQPAVWPVPQVDLACEASQFWNTLRSGRLRSPICEPKILQTWLFKCESSHPMCWWTGPKAFLRLRLFDVKFRCVRQFQLSSDNTVRYVALSYVWGSQAQRLSLCRANHKVLSQKGAINLDQVSRTISDAATVVEMLGERYLWVDALCILQDDQDDLAEQIPVMGQIYMRSLLTIMAAASVDSNSGLPGVSTQVRSAQCISGPLNGGALLRTCRPKYREDDVGGIQRRQMDYLQDSKWDTRGWTFQEKVLSRRCLFFMEEQVYWECQRASWCEETCLETDPKYRFRWEVPNLRFLSDIDFPVGKRMAGKDVIWSYSRLIEEYTSRTLTCAQDTYKAFSGLVHILEDLTGAEIFHGLHVSAFNRSLCWDHKGSSSLRPGDEFPTWSWLAWTGQSTLASQGPQTHIPLVSSYRVRSNKYRERELTLVTRSLRYDDGSDTLSVRDLAIDVRLQLRDDFHIVFWAEAALLDNRRRFSWPNKDPEPPNNEYKPIYYVNSGENDRYGVQEFIRIRIEAYDEFASSEDTRWLQLLMISWQDGIARRVGVASFDSRKWTEAKPQRKLIVMG